jgi:hypothetical protein
MVRGAGLLQFGEIGSHLQDAASAADEEEITKYMKEMLQKAIDVHKTLKEYIGENETSPLFSFDHSLFPGDGNSSAAQPKIGQAPTVSTESSMPQIKFETNSEEEKMRVRKLEMFYNATYGRNGILRNLTMNFKKGQRGQFKNNLNYLLERVKSLGSLKFSFRKKSLLAIFFNLTPCFDFPL